MPQHAAFGNPAIRQFMRDSHNKNGYRTPHKPKHGYKLLGLLTILAWVLW